MTAMRAAIYWAPTPHSALWRAGCAWLGRDAETGATLPQPGHAGIAVLTEDARRYGFHATLRPPMRIATGWPEFCAAAEAIAARHAAFRLPDLRVESLGGFLALTLSAESPALHALAEDCVCSTDRHRLPPTESELARRRKAGLDAQEERLLLAHGYPYVRDRWRFHMTLSARMDAAQTQLWLPRAKAHFAEALAEPAQVSELALFTESAPAAPLLIAERMPLTRPA